MEEMLTCIRLYQRLLAKHSSAEGTSVPCAPDGEGVEQKDEKDDDDAEAEAEAEADEADVKSPSTRGKGKAKKTTTTPAATGENVVGTRVRKGFETKKGNVEYDGTVRGDGPPCLICDLYICRYSP